MQKGLLWWWIISESGLLKRRVIVMEEKRIEVTENEELLKEEVDILSLIHI